MSGKPLETALRAYLERFRLPGASQSIDRIMEEFAKHYDRQNAGLFDSGPDCAHVLSFATIILNTDAHYPNVKKKNKMTKVQFVKMNRGIDGGKDVDRALLEGIYDSISREQIQTGWETGVVTFFTGAARNGTARLTRRSSRARGARAERGPRCEERGTKLETATWTCRARLTRHGWAWRESERGRRRSCDRCVQGGTQTSFF